MGRGGEGEEERGAPYQWRAILKRVGLWDQGFV